MVKKIIKGYLPGFITGIIVCGTVSVLAMTYFPSKDTTYDNSNSGLESTNVQGAIDELYKTCMEGPSGSDTITDLLPSNSDELYKDEHGDIRYYGVNPNNYVSFNNELWRIMGVIDGKIKIIRNESIGNYAWASNDSTNWDNSSLKDYLNGDYYNSIDGTYKNMISKETYYLGGPTSKNTTTLTASGYYSTERDNAQVYSGNPASTIQYIGLMYPSDYGYAAGSSCLSTALYSYNGSCKDSNYLFSKKNEWLQTPLSDGDNRATVIFNTGMLQNPIPSVSYSGYAVRPVLYLSSDVQITGGDGSQSNPYTIAN